MESCDASHESCDASCESHDCTEVRMKCFAKRAMWCNLRKVRRLKERLDFHSKASAIQGIYGVRFYICVGLCSMIDHGMASVVGD